MTSTTAAPVPPQRHSSMRHNSNNASLSLHTAQQHDHHHTATNKVGRLIVDLESKFSNHFHNVTEFRQPPPFTNFPKSYPSLNVKTANGMYFEY